MNTQDSKLQDNLINEQFDKLILNDQKRTVTTVAGIQSRTQSVIPTLSESLKSTTLSDWLKCLIYVL